MSEAPFFAFVDKENTKRGAHTLVQNKNNEDNCNTRHGYSYIWSPAFGEMCIYTHCVK